MPAPPLTHHEIVELIAPFTQRGRPVDLATSDRAQRRLAFKPRPDAAATGLQETLELECHAGPLFRLTRTLRRADGLQATLTAQGGEAGALLDRVEAVPPAQHFDDLDGAALARSYLVAPSLPGAPPTLKLERARVRVDGWELQLEVPAQRGISGDLRLVPPGDALPTLPEDLLAVAGWNWSRLVREPLAWHGKLRLLGGSLRRTRVAEAELRAIATHLARTFAAPPASYHARLAGRRWGVFLRRGIPAFTGLALLASIVTLTGSLREAVEHDPILWTMLFHVPTGLFVLSFALQELPRLEIPPLPRALPFERWRPERPSQ